MSVKNKHGPCFQDVLDGGGGDSGLIGMIRFNMETKFGNSISMLQSGKPLWDRSDTFLG